MLACSQPRLMLMRLQYVTNQATRIIVRAVGELGISTRSWLPKVDIAYHADVEEEAEPPQQTILDGGDGATGINYQTYIPKIVGDEWILSETDLCEATFRHFVVSHYFSAFIQEGCGVLGTVRHYHYSIN
jgi:hypothetical protein